MSDDNKDYLFFINLNINLYIHAQIILICDCAGVEVS